MKYIKLTLKYMKSNPWLLLALAVAAVALAPTFDMKSFSDIAATFDRGTIGASFTMWIKLFLPFNVNNVWFALLSVACYVVLVVDLAFIQSLTDKHVRFGTLSLKSLGQSFNINVINGLVFAVFMLIAYCIFAVIWAAVMDAICLFKAPYFFILGVAICTGLYVLMLYLFSLFILWVPCADVTGFKKYEAFSYGYSLASDRRGKLFVAVLIPSVIAWVVGYTIGFASLPALTFTVIPVLGGLLFVYLSVLAYIAYADAEGLEREDLKKY